MTCLLLLLHICCIFHVVLSGDINGDMENPRQSKLYSNSVVAMTKLLQMENELLMDLKNYAKEMQQKLNMIALFQGMLQRPALHDPELQEEYVGNPLNAFSLLRRLQQDWPKWLTYLQGSQKIEQMHLKLMQAPSEKDLNLASDGLLRLESFYELEASHMAKGLILGKQYNAHLNAVDCMTLGTRLFNHTKYSESTHWFRTALRLYQKPYGKLYGQVLGLKRKQLYRSYALAMAREPHSAAEQSKDSTPAEWQHIADKMLNEAVLGASNAKIKKFIDEYLEGDEQIFIKQRAKERPKLTTLQRGCRGLWPQRKDPQRLTCHYKRKISAFLKLAPLKVEILNKQPLIMLYHQVLTENAIKSLKYSFLNQTAKDFEKESAKLFPLADISASLRLQLTQILPLATVTDTTIHIYNYGLGGHLPKHSNSTCRNAKAKSTDFKERCHSKHLATMLIYASDVTLGGATVFPNLKLVVQPKKGDALIWLNRNADYKPEKLTQHAVCPVLMGSRWVISNCIAVGSELLDQPCLA